MRGFRPAAEVEIRVAEDSEISEDSENGNSFDAKSAEARKDAEKCVWSIAGKAELPAQVEPRGRCDSPGTMNIRAAMSALTPRLTTRRRHSELSDASEPSATRFSEGGDTMTSARRDVAGSQVESAMVTR